MTPMVKTQVYFEARDLKALHALARQRKRRVAEMIREAVRSTWLKPASEGPVALTNAKLRGTSLNHESAFDSIE